MLAFCCRDEVKFSKMIACADRKFGLYGWPILKMMLKIYSMSISVVVGDCICTI